MEKDETSFDDFCCNMRDSAAQKQFRKDGNDGETEASWFDVYLWDPFRVYDGVIYAYNTVIMHLPRHHALTGSCSDHRRWAHFSE